MTTFPTPTLNTRIGFHYYPDSLHYRESDLAIWLPELSRLGASWLTLFAPPDRAIPEAFIQGLLGHGIEPVLHLHLPLGSPTPSRSSPQDLRLLRMLFKVYAQWGVHYVVLFDRPNLRNSWSASTWAQPDLVERFLDAFIPLAEAALGEGLFPVFPPLEPGGDYWDTAWLQHALVGIQRRKRVGLLEKLVLGAYAWSAGRSLNWGAGGPECWPASKPYTTPPASQDQRGFRIFDWYLALAQAILGEPHPVLIVGGGSRVMDGLPLDQHAQINLAIASLMRRAGSQIAQRDPLNGELLDPVPEQILACHFWLLATPSGSHYAPDAWFQSDGKSLPVVGAFQQMVDKGAVGLLTPPYDLFPDFQPGSSQPMTSAERRPLIEHYLLLPSYDWGVSDWHLDCIRPFIKKYRPTVGFSPEEACLARCVTIVSGEYAYSDDVVKCLRQSGCTIQRICEDGTDIATSGQSESWPVRAQ